MSHIIGVFSSPLPFGKGWTHSGTYVEACVDGCMQAFVVEARLFFGVVPTPIDVFRKRWPRFTFVAFECPDPAAARARAWSRVGTGYDYLGAVKAFFGLKTKDDGSLDYCQEGLEMALLSGRRRVFVDQELCQRPMDLFEKSIPLIEVDPEAHQRLNCIGGIHAH